MNTSPESLLSIKITLLFLIIVFLITSIMACVTKDEKKADHLRVKAIALSYIPALMMILKFRVDVLVSASFCLFIVTFFTINLKKEILKKIFVKWVAATYMLLAILALIFFHFS